MMKRTKTLFLLALTLIVSSVCGIAALEPNMAHAETEPVKVEFIDLLLPKDSGIWFGDRPSSNTYVASWNPEKLTLVPGSNTAVAVKFTAPCDGTMTHDIASNYFFAPNDPSEAGRDVTRFSVIKNDEVIYPSSGIWENVPYYDNGNGIRNFEISETSISAGESVYYICENGGNNNVSYDTLELKVNFLWKDAAHPEGVTVSLKDNYYYDKGAETVNFGDYEKQEIFSYVSMYNIAEKDASLYMALDMKTLNEYDSLTSERKTLDDTSKTFSSNHWGISSGVSSATAHVVQVPENVIGVQNIEVGNFDIVSGVAGTYFAILYQHADSDDAKMIYPANGVWRDVSVADAVKKVNISAIAGDRIIIAMYDSTLHSYNAFLPIYMNINGKYWDATKTAWYNPADGENTTSEYYNGTYKYSDILSYEYFQVSYPIAYTMNGGTNSATNPSQYCTLIDNTLSNPTKKNAGFDGWKKGSETVTKIAKGTIGTVTLNAEWTDYTAQISQAGITLNENVAMNLYVTAEEGFELEGINITYKGEAYVLNDYTLESGKYVYTFSGIAPQYLNEKVHASLIGSDSSVNISVQDYLVGLMGKTSEELGYTAEKYAQMKQLVIDLLHYGAAAQTFLDINTDALATSVLEAEDVPSAFVKPASSDYAKSGTLNSSYRWYEAGVRYTDSVGLYFVVAANSEITLKITDGDDMISLTESTIVGEKDGLTLYKFNYNQVSLTRFDSSLQAKIYLNEEEVGETLVYSVSANVYALSDAGAYSILLQRAYMYGVSAKLFTDTI